MATTGQRCVDIFFFLTRKVVLFVCVRTCVCVCIPVYVPARGVCRAFFFFFTFFLLARLVISTLHSLLNSFVARSQRGIKNACLKTARGEKELDTGFERDGYAFLFAG